MLSAWFAAALVAALAVCTLKVVAPAIDQGEPVDEYAQVLRVHLPWLLFCAFMAVTSGSYVRDRNGGLGRVVATLPVPLLGAVAAAALGIPFSDTTVGLVLHLIEAVLGVALGLALSRSLSRRWAAEAVDAGRRGGRRKVRR